MLARETGQPVADPVKLIVPMLERLIATDREFAKDRGGELGILCRLVFRRCRGAAAFGQAIGLPGRIVSNFPVRWQEVWQTTVWRVSDAGEDVGEPGLWIDVVELRRADQGIYMTAARSEGGRP